MIQQVSGLDFAWIEKYPFRDGVPLMFVPGEGFKWIKVFKGARGSEMILDSSVQMPRFDLSQKRTVAPLLEHK